jgi:hypothetical protein
MRRVTEQAVQYGLEENVMEALFDVLDAAAQARDTPGPAGDDVFVQPERSAG